MVLNDGTKQYQHHSDGLNQESGGCLKDFRNRPYPVKLRIIYLRGTLEVSMERMNCTHTHMQTHTPYLTHILSFTHTHTRHPTSHTHTHTQLWVHEGISLTEDDYELCTKLENIPGLAWIPREGYFGVTAATGGLSDDHDVLSFITHSLTPLEERSQEVSGLLILTNAHGLLLLTNAHGLLIDAILSRNGTWGQRHCILSGQLVY